MNVSALSKPPSLEATIRIARDGHLADTTTFGSFVNCAPLFTETPVAPGAEAGTISSPFRSEAVSEVPRAVVTLTAGLTV